MAKLSEGAKTLKVGFNNSWLGASGEHISSGCFKTTFAVLSGSVAAIGCADRGRRVRRGVR